MPTLDIISSSLPILELPSESFQGPYVHKTLTQNKGPTFSIGGAAYRDPLIILYISLPRRIITRMVGFSIRAQLRASSGTNPVVMTNRQLR